jgi:hypothetical protein
LQSGFINQGPEHISLSRQILYARERTFNFLMNEWDNSRWEYHGIPSAITSPKLLVELAAIAPWNDRKIVLELTKYCLNQITHSGRVINEQNLQKYGISELQQLARIGFVLQEFDYKYNLGHSKLINLIRENIALILRNSPKIGPEDITFCLYTLLGVTETQQFNKLSKK